MCAAHTQLCVLVTTMYTWVTNLYMHHELCVQDTSQLCIFESQPVCAGHITTVCFSHNHVYMSHEPIHASQPMCAGHITTMYTWVTTMYTWVTNLYMHHELCVQDTSQLCIFESQPCIHESRTYTCVTNCVCRTHHNYVYLSHNHVYMRHNYVHMSHEPIHASRTMYTWHITTMYRWVTSM